MKKRYENYGKVVFGFCLLLFSILVIVIYLINKKIVIYKVFSGVVYNDNVLVLVLSDEELKLFNKNKRVFIENKSKNFKIKKIDVDILERDGEEYNQVFINIDISNMYKVNDVINISIMEKNVRSYKIFSIIWEGD